MAIQHFNSYPHFVANQVLKSSDLNNSFGFLDEQARLSRLHMVGQGILSGLDAANWKNTALLIRKGFAVNGGGWVVQLNEDTEYHFVAKVPYRDTPFETDNLEDLVAKGGGRVEYICFKTEDDARELGLAPVPMSTVLKGNYLVALAYGTRRELSNRCSHDSCDINVTSLLTEAWPVLVKPGSAPLFRILPACEQRIFPFKPIRLKSTSNIKLFNAALKSAFEEQRGEWVRVMKTVFSQVFGQKYVKTQKGVGFVSKPSPWDHVLPESRQLFGRLNGCIVKTENLFASGKEDFVPDYCLSYLDDLRRALNELIETYNEYAAETVYLPDWIPEGRLIYLGWITKLWDKSYKSLFRKADVLASESAALRLERMIRRIHILSEHFIGTESPKQLSARLTSVAVLKPGVRFSDRPIPFYYAMSDDIEFLSVWNADKSSTYRNAPDYGCRELGGTRKNGLMAPGSGMEYYLEAYQFKPFATVKASLNNNSPLAWMNLTVKEIPLKTVRRLTPEQTNVLKKYFASTSFRSFLPEVVKKGNTKMTWLANKLDAILYILPNTSLVTSFIDALRTGDDYNLHLSYDFSKELKNNVSELWEMTRFLKTSFGLKYPDKKNRFADPLYSAFLNLFNILADRAEMEILLNLACLNGPIRPGSTVCLLTKDGKVISYAVNY